jgi:hypothetical protein
LPFGHPLFEEKARMDVFSSAYLVPDYILWSVANNAIGRFIYIEVGKVRTSDHYLSRLWISREYPEIGVRPPAPLTARLSSRLCKSIQKLL